MRGVTSLKTKQKLLYPIIAKEAWKQNFKAYINYGQITIKGQTYTGKTLNNLPSSLNPMKIPIQKYHRQVKMVKTNKDTIVKNRMVNAMCDNRERDLQKEVNKILMLKGLSQSL